MVFSLFEYLDSVSCNQSFAINFGKFLTKNAITFYQKEIERKKRYLVGMKFCCASNAAMKKNQLFPQNIINKIAIF